MMERRHFLLVVALFVSMPGCVAGAENAIEQDAESNEGMALPTAGPAESEGRISSSESAGLEIPQRFRGVWVFNPEFCENPEDEPATFITAEGFRREELWGEAQEIRSISPDGTEMHLIMGYRLEAVEMTLYESRWILSNLDNRLQIDETNLWVGADHHEDPHEELVRCR